MSLRVWLPLTGTTENKGLDRDYDAPISNKSYPVWATEGKIGSQSLYPTTTTSGVLSYSKTLSNSQSYSICAWVKSTDSATGSRYVIWTGSDSNSVGFGMRIASNGTVCNCVMFGTSIGVTINLNEWHHVAMTIDYENLQFSAYLDGVFVNKKSYTVNTVSDQGFNIGWLRPSYYPFKGYINDVRLYDHCLSPKEVKEIAQGLVMHYPLNDTYSESTTNIAYNQAMYWSGLQASASGTKSGETYTVTIGALSGSYTFATARMTIPTGVLQDSVQYAVSFKYKSISGGGLIVVDQVGFDWCDASFTSTQVEQIEDYYYVKLVCPIRSSYASYHFMDYRFSVPNSKYQIWDLQIEAKDHDTPYVAGTRTPTMVYDCSGYGNDGAITGSLSVSSNTPRYDACVQIPTINDYITIPLPQQQEFTYTFWFKRDRVSQTNREMIMTGWYGVSFELNPNNTLTFRCQGTDAAHDAISTSVFNQTGVWNHAAMVRRSGVCTELYINGVKERTVDWTANINYSVSVATIGRYKNSSYAFLGELSDFRVYSTALSDEDIKELYNTPTNIDNHGNMHTFEFVEDEVTDEQILKTGLTKADMFVEKYFESLYDETDAEFTDRAIPSVAVGDVCKITSVKGKSLVWNQLAQVDGPYTRTIDGLTITYSRGHIHIEGTTTASTGGRTLGGPFSYIATHQYYIKWIGDKGGLTNAYSRLLFYNPSDSARIITATGSASYRYSFIIYYESDTAINADIDYEVIDLTQIFGEGNEPETVEEFEALYPLPYYDYNPGELVNNAASGVEMLDAGGNSLGTLSTPITEIVPADKSTVRLNQLVVDEDISKSIDGAECLYDAATGLWSYENLSRTTNFRSGSSVVKASQGFSAGHKIYIWADSQEPGICVSKSNAPAIAILPGTIATVDRNGYYFFLRVTKDYDFVTAHPIGNIYQFRLMFIDLTEMYGAGNEPTSIAEVEELIGADYIPYNTGDDIPNRIFPVGMKSAGSVADEWSGNTAIKRIGSRAYHSGDENGSSVVTDGTTTYYPLSTPVTYTVDALPDTLVPFDAQGTQRRLPVDTSEEVAAPMVCDLQYGEKTNKCNLQIYKDRIETNQLIEK